MTARLLAALALSCGLLVTGAARAQGGATPYEKLITQHASAMVNIKFTSKMDSNEEEGEIPGVMIEKTGLVLTSNDSLRGVSARFGAPAATATNMKVLVGEDTEGVDAKIVARDSELGLAWVQIDKPAEAGYVFVDFGSGSQVRAGESIMVISQLSKFFDRAASVSEGVVSCVTAKPRKMMIPSLALATAEWGVPVFDAQAKPVGIMTIVLPEKEELEAIPGGPGEILKGIPGGKLILPADEVAAATKRAKEAAASGKGEPATEAPKEAPKAEGAPVAAPAAPK